MADHSRLPLPDRCGMLSIGSVCRACKSLVKCHSSDKHSSSNNADEDHDNNKLKSFNKAHKAANDKNDDEKTRNGVHNLESMMIDQSSSPRGFYKHRTMDNFFMPMPSPLSSPVPNLLRSASTAAPRTASAYPFPLSRSSSRMSKTPTRSASSALLRSLSRKSIDGDPLPSLSRSTSRKGPAPLVYSNSSGLLKPPSIERELVCTLEELCFGCIKKLTVTRDVVTDNGEIIQEEEILTIKVKPGWSKGTKITFDGMGNEAPGNYPADITFVIAEKRHRLYRREGDDLELAVEIPLVDALTGCTIPIPLVGGEKISLTVDEIIHPGYEKIIAGQGMPKSKEQGERGNLTVKFLVNFPEELTDKQRSDVYSILQDSC